MAILSTIRIAVDGAQARRELNRFESGFARVAGSIRKMTAAIGIGGGIGIIAGLQAAIRRAVSESSSIEILEVAFTNLSGSAEVAQNILRKLEEQASKTGVSVADQADAVRKFLALGFDPDRALTLQKSILDVAGSMGLTSFQAGQLGFAISQVAAKGVVSMEELRQQIAEKGVPVFEALAQKIGVSTGEVIKLVSEGKIASDTLLEIFENYEGPFSKFEGGAEKLGATLSGVFNRIRANLVLVFRALGDPIRDTLKQSLGPLIDDVEKLKGTATLFGQELASAVRQLFAGDLRGAISDFIADAPAKIRDFGDVLRDVGSVAKSLASIFIGVGGAVAENIKAIAALTTAYVGLKAVSATVGALAIFKGVAESAQKATGVVLQSLNLQKIAARKTAKEVITSEKAVTAAKTTTAAADKELTRAATLRGSVERKQASVIASAENRVSAAKTASLNASKAISAAENDAATRRKLAATTTAEVVSAGEVRISRARAALGQANVRLQIAEANLNAARVSGSSKASAAIRAVAAAKSEVTRRGVALASVQKSVIADRVAAENAAALAINRAEERVQLAKLRSKLAEEALTRANELRAAAATASSAAITKAIERENAARLILLGSIKAQRDVEIAANAARLAATQTGAASPTIVAGFGSSGKKAGNAFTKGFGAIISRLGPLGRGAASVFGKAFTFIAGGALIKFIGTASLLFAGWEIAKIINDKLKISENVKDTWYAIFHLQKAIDRAASDTTGELITQLGQAKSLAEADIVRYKIKQMIKILEKESKDARNAELDLLNAEIAALQKALDYKKGGKEEVSKEADELTRLKEQYDSILAAQSQIGRDRGEAQERAKQEALFESLKGQEKLNALREKENKIIGELEERQGAEIFLSELQKGINQWEQAIESQQDWENGVRSFGDGLDLTLEEAKAKAAELTKELSSPEAVDRQKELLAEIERVTKEKVRLEQQQATPDDRQLAIAEAIADANESAFLEQATREQKLAALAKRRLELEEEISKAFSKEDVGKLQKELQDNISQTSALALEGIQERRDKELGAAEDVLQKRLEIIKSYGGDERERLERLGVRFGGRDAGPLPSFIRQDLAEANINNELEALKNQTKEIVLTREEIAKLPEKIGETLETSGVRCSTERPTVF